MKTSAANRRRSTWPLTDITRTQLPPGCTSAVDYVRDNMEHIAANVARTCSEVCPGGCLARDLAKVTQAQQSVNSSREKV